MKTRNYPISVLGAIAAAILVACGSSGSDTTVQPAAGSGGSAGAAEAGSSDAAAAGGTDAGGSCVSANECAQWQCTCTDGTVFLSPRTCAGGDCHAGDIGQCAPYCQPHGGTDNVQISPNVANSSECDAFCAKVASLGCTGNLTCDRYFYCLVTAGSCEAAARAKLKCKVDKGNWTCNQDAGGWEVDSSECSQSEECGSDSGPG
jgi:hypothetical protein